jgi:hypothetical protein
MVAFNIVSMSCFKLVSASSSSSSSSSSSIGHARRSVSRDREGGLAADLPGGGSMREVTRRRRWRSEQYQVNWRCLAVFTGKSRVPSVSLLWLLSLSWNHHHHDYYYHHHHYSMGVI